MTKVDAAFKCLEALQGDTGLRRATAFISDNGTVSTVKATRQHKPDGRVRHETFIVTIGRPNYNERRSIRRDAGKDKLCAALRLTRWPVKKAA